MPRPFLRLAVVPVVALTALMLHPADPALAQQGAPLSERIDIVLENGTDRERATADQLRALLDDYDVGRWVWTDRVRIAAGEIPHSHPVLTLHTRALGNPHDQLSTWLHEQFHWWVVERSEAEEGAIAAFRELFPEVPVGGREGGRDEYSTWLHLIVCDLEYQAMASLVGEERARELLAATNHYTWIYDAVLNDPRVREINLAHGFDVMAVDTRGAGR